MGGNNLTICASTNCNIGLGYFQDSEAFLAKAIEYLRLHPLYKCNS